MGKFIEGWKDEEARKENYLIYKELGNDHVPQMPVSNNLIAVSPKRFFDGSK